MSAEILMPRLSDSMEEGTILAWLKTVGEPVAVGDELVEIETDKANMVFEADAAGMLLEVVAEGKTLPIGAVIARVGEGGEQPPAEDQQAATGNSAASKRSERAEDAEPAEPAVPARGEDDTVVETQAAPGRLRASPLARRIAAERGIDLSSIPGSGPGGRIVRADVEEPGSAQPPPMAAGPRHRPADGGTAKGAVTVIEPTKLQETVARRMAESKATAPHFYISAEIDMSRSVAARAALKRNAGEGEIVPSLNDMVVKAAASALLEHPRVNGSYRDGRFELYERVNVGVAVAGQDALVVPTIFDADRKGLREIAAESRTLAGKVRDSTVTPPELSGGTFTVSNLGMYGMASIGPVINPPQAAILGIGEVKERPVAHDAELRVGMIMGVTLAADHRILYGAEVAEFLARVKMLLEEPMALAY